MSRVAPTSPLPHHHNRTCRLRRTERRASEPQRRIPGRDFSSDPAPSNSGSLNPARPATARLGSSGALSKRQHQGRPNATRPRHVPHFSTPPTGQAQFDPGSRLVTMRAPVPSPAASQISVPACHAILLPSFARKKRVALAGKPAGACSSFQCGPRYATPPFPTRVVLSHHPKDSKLVPSGGDPSTSIQL